MVNETEIHSSFLCQEETVNIRRGYSAMKLTVTKTIRLTNENRSFIQHFARGTAAPFATIRSEDLTRFLDLTSKGLRTLNIPTHSVSNKN